MRVKPLTGFEISTFAPAIAPPDASFTTPSIDPELPNCARAGIAPKHRLKSNISPAKLPKLFNMISPCPVGGVWLVNQGRSYSGGGLASDCVPSCRQRHGNHRLLGKGGASSAALKSRSEGNKLQGNHQSGCFKRRVVRGRDGEGKLRQAQL